MHRNGSFWAAFLLIVTNTLFGQTAPPRNLAISKLILQPYDFTIVGAFFPPLQYDPNFVSALTLRHVGGIPRLYSLVGTGDYAGQVMEYAIPSDSQLKSSDPFNTATLTNLFGDIFQQKLYSSDGGGQYGLKQGARVNGLFWDDLDSRMYWTHTVSYGGAAGADPSVGYSILNDTSHTGTGIGMWKLFSPTNGGSRYSNGMLSIPSNYAQQLGGRLAVGFGGYYSAMSDGPVSMGPALVAVDPAAFTPQTNMNYPSVSPSKLLMYSPNQGTHRAPRNAAIPSLNYVSIDGSFYGTTGFWGWYDAPPAGVWIETPTKHGVLFPALVGYGNLNTTITGTPSKSSFTLSSADTLFVGGIIRVSTDYNPNAQYPFETVRITGISGKTVTVSPSLTGNPLVPGSVIAGVWYQGGGQVSTGLMTPFYIYDPEDLVKVKRGILASDMVQPKSNSNMALPHIAYPIPDDSWYCHPTGATFDSNTNRLYVMYSKCYKNAANDWRPLVYVFHVN